MNQRLQSALVYAATVAAATLSAATSALADDATIDNTQFVSTLTRAEVRADLMSHRDQVTHGSNEWVLQQNEPRRAESSYTSEQARDEFIARREEVRSMNSEQGGDRYAAPAPVSVAIPSSSVATQSLR